MIRLLRAAAVLITLAPVLPAPALVPAVRAVAADDEFAIGVLRRDGAVIPFAAFDGRWTTPWPADLSGLDLPITLGDVPRRWWGGIELPSELTAWADGARLGVVRLDKPAMMPVMCEARMTLRSDYKSAQPLPPLMAQPFPKDGLVVTPGGPPIQALRAVDKASGNWSSAAVTILDAFNEAEEVASRGFTDWRHPYPRSARERMTIQLEALYTAPMDEEGWTAYYVEAVRRFPPGPEDEGCGLVTFTSGWVRIGPKDPPRMDLSSRITYCDRTGASFMLPLGLMTVDDKNFWIYQISGFDREWYVVARPTTRGIELHAEYHAGSCPII